VPGGQLREQVALDVAPMSTPYVPGGQAVQAATPVCPLYLPKGQLVHVELDVAPRVALYVPAQHANFSAGVGQ